MSMNQNAGMADSGIATAAISVARQSRRNSHTTRTANIAPSIIAWIADLYCAIVSFTLVNSST